MSGSGAGNTHPHVCYPFFVTFWLLMIVSLSICSHWGVFLQFVAVLSFPVLFLSWCKPSSLCSVLCLPPKPVQLNQQKTPEQQTKKPTQKFSHQFSPWGCSRVEKSLCKGRERRGHCSQQEREVSSLLPAATSCCVSCPGSTGFCGILKFNQPVPSHYWQ